MSTKTRPAVKGNISWINDTLACGGDFSYTPERALAQLDDLLQQDVGYVIDCRQEADDFEAWMPVDGVQYHWLPSEDRIGYHMPPQHFDRAVAIARRAEAEGRKVFVHCHMGVNRGPSTAFAILLDRGMDPVAAFDLIRERRPQAGISYAEDALVAHLDRQGAQVDWGTLDTFIAHYEAVMTPEVQEGIQHKIRQHHQRDRAERFA